MRLLVLNQDCCCRLELLGELKSSSTLVNLDGVEIPLESSDWVVTPVATHDAKNGETYLLLKRAPNGAVVLAPTPSGEPLYFSKEEVEDRSSRSGFPFFPSMIEGSDRWFLEVRAPKFIETADLDDGELSYEEDGCGGPGDSLGPADTNIF